ncbi:hypothetical protein COU60_04515 [Candidatus Pacearchaeota archaeon CG10_big_fil_rev_8_21_14_0_10_34_76]|nr:MAG: hypothetical protein COU60_04515 [Candidatus Pacearchaeota archaeon CG10_big_fil_rev_8_21_14_0_10_34_76]
MSEQIIYSGVDNKWRMYGPLFRQKSLPPLDLPHPEYVRAQLEARLPDLERELEELGNAGKVSQAFMRDTVFDI